jgi:two-component system, LytTR family, sensor kinase
MDPVLSHQYRPESVDNGLASGEGDLPAGSDWIVVDDGASAAAWSSWGSWLSLWTYAFIVYTGLVVLAVTSHVLESIQVGSPVHLPSLIGHRALEEYTCAVFVPPLFWLVHRFPIDRRHWRRSAPVLLAASVACVIIKYVAIYLPLMWIIFPQDRATVVSTMPLYVTDVLAEFWGIIGVAHAIEFYRRAQGRERLAAELHARLSQAQLDAIRSQLHPHFLFNALNGIATLMHRDVHSADRMVTNLADLLRATLQYSDTPEIPLSEELALLERYLAIAALRFPDRLRVNYEIAPDVRDALVPQFLLQPLAENAVEHGIARRATPGTLVVGATHVADRLLLSIYDDGPEPRSNHSAGMGIGLTNTRLRLQAMYGDEHELHIEPASQGRGFHVRILLPYRHRSVAQIGSKGRNDAHLAAM